MQTGGNFGVECGRKLLKRALLALAALALLVVLPAGAQEAHLQNGVNYLKRQEFAKALEEFQLAHTAHPEDATIDNLIGITETQLGHLEEANRWYERAIHIRPDEAAPHRNLGHNYLTAKQYSEAEKELKTAERLAPENPFAHYYLAELYLETSRDADAFREFQPAHALLENDPASLFLMAQACVRLGKGPEAAELIHSLEAGGKLGPGEEYKLGVLLTSKRMYPEAADRFRALVRLQPDSWQSKFDLAIALVNDNQLQEAILTLRPLASQEIGDARPLALLGALYEATNELPKALDAYAAAVRVDPEDPNTYLDYTRLLMDLDRYGEAARIVQQGMKDTPDSYALYLRMGSIEMTQGQYAVARASFEKAIAQHPEIALGYIALAEGYMRDGKDQQAANVLSAARKKLPPDAMLEYLYGLTLSHLNRAQDAVAVLKHSIALNSKVAESHYELGKLYLQMGNEQAARIEFEQVLAIAPEHANAHFQLSRIYAHLGEMKKSKEMAAETQALLQKQRQAALQEQKKRLGSFRAEPAS